MATKKLNSADDLKKMVAILKKAKKGLGGADFMKKTRFNRSRFYSRVKLGLAEGKMHQTDDRKYHAGKGKGARTSKTKTCRTCSESKPMTNQHYARMSPVAMSKMENADGFMPDCRACTALTPTMLHTVKMVKEHGQLTAVQLERLVDITKGAASNRLKSGADVGLLKRVGLGVYAVTETGASLNLDRAGVHSARSLVDKVVKVPTATGGMAPPEDAEIAADLLFVAENAELNPEERGIVMSAARRLGNLPVSRFAPTSGDLMEVK